MNPRATPVTTKRGRGSIGVRRLTRADEIRDPQIRRAVRMAARDTPIRCVNVALVGDRAMTDLHVRYLADPRTTDVLTFDLRDDADQPEIEGEIAVCVDVARRQARRWRTSVTAELLRYVVHGVLHLLGYDDDVPARQRRMRRAENRVLADMAPKGHRNTRAHPPTGRMRQRPSPQRGTGM